MSTTYAAASCGFLPLHLYEGPSLERAAEVCAAINRFALESMGFGPVPAASRGLLDPMPLREMLNALDEVERFNGRPKMLGVPYSSHMVPAERLVAAVYTLLNFAPTRGADKEDDEIPVRFTAKRWGDDYVHFMLIGQRLRSELQDEEDDPEQQDDRGLSITSTVSEVAA